MSNFSETAVPCFETVDALQAGLTAKAAFEAVDLYPRDGTRQLGEVETHIAELARVEPDELVLCCSGMAAVVGAIEACTQAGETIACSEQLYSQTNAFISNWLPRQGIKVVRFDPGCLDDISRQVEKHRPSVIISETVANDIGAAVLDVDGLVDLDPVLETDPFIILDHTLPLSTGRSLRPFLTEQSKVVAVESGTKSYTFNQELSGLIYSGNPNILQSLRTQRRTKGFLPNLAGVERINELLPDSLADFDARNQAIAETTAELAIAAGQATKDNPNLNVWHPSVNHPQEQLVREHYQTPGTPVLFISCSEPGSQIELTRQLWSHPVVQSECELGQSFGFDKTRILYDTKAPFVRIAGGAYTDTTKLALALGEVLVQV